MTLAYAEGLRAKLRGASNSRSSATSQSAPENLGVALATGAASHEPEKIVLEVRASGVVEKGDVATQLDAAVRRAVRLPVGPQGDAPAPLSRR